MDKPRKNMDFLFTHWAAVSRRHPSPFPLMTANLLERKTEWIRRAFQSCNFSLILAGRGTFRRAGVVHEVVAPCVITQWPGEHVEYGPPPGGYWTELFLIYDSSLFRPFQKHRLLDSSRPIWPIRNLPAVETQIAEFALLTRSAHPEDVVDRVDRVAERLILETHLALPGVADGDESRIIHGLLDELRRDLRREVDLDELASQHGISQATLRRRWAQFVRTPPARYRLELRLREACRLLTETARPIHEIAHSVGFDDELYFSRRFRQEMRFSPRAYRRMYQGSQR